eukprot:COSAG04_NODE_21156_length_379_cov_0.621429_1_plen_32_part_01
MSRVGWGANPWRSNPVLGVPGAVRGYQAVAIG